MKTKILSIMAVMAMTFGLTACNDDNWVAKLDDEGTLKLSTLTVDVSTAEKLISRDGTEYDTSNFIVEILSGEGVVASWTYSKMPEILTLPVGDYTARVKSHQVQKQEWDKPYFLGSKTFSIASNDITEIGNVVCKFANVKVDIVIADDLRAHLGEGSKVTVLVNDEGRLDFTPDETRSGFFEAVNESNTLVSTFTGNVDGAPVTIQNTYINVAPGTHYRITYSIKSTDTTIDETGWIDPASGITVSMSVEDVNVNGNIAVDEDNINPGQRPGTEGEDPVTPPVDPGTDPTPGTNDISFSSTTLSFETENSVDVPEAVVKLNSANGFSHLYVKIESDNQNFIDSAGEMLPLEFDLANAGDKAEDLASLGLPVGPYAAGTTSLDFNITDLVPLLAAFPGHHSFSLTVVDNNNASKSLTLKFIAQ